MTVKIPGHVYFLENFEDKTKDGKPYGQEIRFIHKEPLTEGSTELRTVLDGTTNEEVLEMLIDRMQTMNAKLPSRESSIIITKLEESLMWMHKRTTDRKNRGVEGTMAK